MITALRPHMSNSTLIRIVYVSFWSLINAASLRLFNIFSMYFAAHRLTPDDFGSVSLMLNTAQTWSIFIAAGIGITLSKYISEYRSSDKTKASSLISTLSVIAVVLGAIVLTLCLIFGETISTLFFENKFSYFDVCVTAIWLQILTYQTVMQGAVTGLEQFKKNAVFGSIGSIISLMLIVFFAPTDRHWIVIFLMAGNIITLASTSSLVYLKVREWRSSYFRIFEFSHIKTLISFGLPTFAGGFVLSQTQWLTNLAITKSDSGLSSMAGLNVSMQWYAIILFIPGAISNAMLPLLSNSLSKHEEQLRIFTTALIINIAAATALSAIALIFNRQLLAQYGEHYLQFGSTFRNLCIAAGINGATSMLTQHLASHGKGLSMFLINILWAIVLLTVSFNYTPGSVSPEAVSSGYIAANFFQALVTGILVYKLLLNRNSLSPIGNT